MLSTSSFLTCLGDIRTIQLTPPDHLLAAIIGPSVVLAIRDGRLKLGTWQRIVLIELDGPRSRDVSLTILGRVNS
jgi:thiamine phosphate synthase YjbQ (UPF0047 family)